MRVDVVDLLRLEAWRPERVAHHAEGAVAVFGRRGDVVGVAAHAVADHLGQNVARRAAARAPVLPEPGCRRLRRPRSRRDPGPTGGEARSGSSLRVESARMAANPPMPIGVIAASVPPQIITSASPRWMRRKESPMACALVVQAVAVAEFGPWRRCGSRRSRTPD